MDVPQMKIRKQLNGDQYHRLWGECKLKFQWDIAPIDSHSYLAKCYVRAEDERWPCTLSTEVKINVAIMGKAWMFPRNEDITAAWSGSPHYWVQLHGKEVCALETYHHLSVYCGTAHGSKDFNSNFVLINECANQKNWSWKRSNFRLTYRKQLELTSNGCLTLERLRTP